jgi:sporulation protein YlmC with PRC-barrel domain
MMETDYTTPSMQRVSDLNGLSVENPEGENLGKIEDLMLDLSNGRASYAVLSFGGVLGIGDKLFAIPWDMLKVDTENYVIVINVDPETLENAPGFDRDNWPDHTDSAWLTNVYNYYGYRPYWA